MQGKRIMLMKKNIITVEIASALKRFTGNEGIVKVENASTVGDVLHSVAQQYPRMRQQLICADGDVKPFIKVFVNSHDIQSHSGLDTVVGGGDCISLLAPVAGG